MANYSLLVTPTYTPRSFEEMVAPYKMYGEYYNALESSLSTLESALADMEKLKQFEGHENLYNEYKTFADQLNVYSDALASGNLKGLRSNIRTAAKDYVKRIKPIEDAYTRAVGQHKAYAEAVAQNPSILNAPSKNLQDYYNDPLYTWKPMSGDYLKSTMGSLAQQYKSQHNGSTSSGGYTTHHFGLNSTEVNELINDDPNALAKQKYPELVTFINQMKAQYGYDAYTPDKQEMFLDYLKQGLVYGIGQDQVTQNPRSTGYSSSDIKTILDGILNPPKDPEEDDLFSSSVPDVDSDPEVSKEVKKINKAETKAEQAEAQRTINHEFNRWSDNTSISKKSQKQFEKRRDNYFKEWTQEDVKDVIDNWEYIFANHKTIGNKFRTINGRFISWEDMQDMNLTSKDKWLLNAEGMDSSVKAAKEHAETMFMMNALTGGGTSLNSLENSYQRIDENAVGITFKNLTHTPDASAQKLRKKAEETREKIYEQYPSYLSDVGNQRVLARDEYFSSLNEVVHNSTLAKEKEEKIVNSWMMHIPKGQKEYSKGLDISQGLYVFNEDTGKWEGAEAVKLTNPSISIDINNGVMISGYDGDKKVKHYKMGKNSPVADIDNTITLIKENLLSSGAKSYKDKQKSVRLPNNSMLHVKHTKDGDRIFYIQNGEEIPSVYLMDEVGNLYKEGTDGYFSDKPRMNINQWLHIFFQSLLQKTLSHVVLPEEE